MDALSLIKSLPSSDNRQWLQVSSAMVADVIGNGCRCSRHHRQWLQVFQRREGHPLMFAASTRSHPP